MVIPYLLNAKLKNYEVYKDYIFSGKPFETGDILE